MKYYIKYLFYRLGAAGWLNNASFRATLVRNRQKNELYKKQYPGIVLPADEVLHETYQLDYQQFIEDGALAAREIISWTKPYLLTTTPNILDWGCGAGRIIRHLPTIQPNALLYACDSNEQLIEWNKTHYGGISFTAINSFPPTLYAPGFFNLVYGFSVLTHIHSTQQQDWIIELHRIIADEGVLFITTHGSNYINQLLPYSKNLLAKKGIFTKSYPIHGHKMMSTYHHAEKFRNLLAPYFVVKEFYAGNQHPQKAGGQDVWILQKKRFQ